MQSPVLFDRPILLLLWPLLVALFWTIGRRSYAGLHPATARLALITRAVVAGLLVLALAGAHLVKRSDTLTTLFLVDTSKSIRQGQFQDAQGYINKALGGKRAADQAGVIVFGRTAFVEDAPSSSLSNVDGLRRSVAGDATDLRDALRTAQTVFGTGTGKKIVILSDGNENIGAAEDEIAALRAQGVRVDIAPTALGSGGGNGPEALVEGVTLPAQARVDAPIPVRVVTVSTVAQPATLTLLRDKVPIAKQQVQLKAGKSAFTFSETLKQPGLHKYEALLEPAQDTVAENNHAEGDVTVQGRPRVLYVTDVDVPVYGALKQAMAAQGIDLQVQTPGGIPADVQALSSYDAVVLSNVPAAEFSPPQQQAMAAACKEFGVGLGMVGGENSYAAGGYQGTPLEDALPVNMDVKDKKRFPSVAVALVIEDLEEPTNVNMSIEAAKSVVDLLQPIDQVGVLDCNNVWRIPMQHVTNRAALKSAMQGLTDMNDPPDYDQYLLTAGQTLQHTPAQIKHIMFLGDGDAAAPSISNIQTVRAMGITISTVATGADAEGIKELAQLASVGGGKAYVAEKPEDLPRLLQRDQQSFSKLRIIEKPFLPQYNGGDPILMGIPFNAEPPLLGYNVSSAKPGATVAMSAPDHRDPVFAYWRYGLGRSFAFTSDDRAHWAVQWLPWEGYSRFWAQTLRWSLRSSARADFQVTAESDAGQGHLVVEAFTPTGGFVNGAPLTARVVAPDLSAKSVSLAQTAPGRYEGRFDTDQTGAYLVNVHQGEGGNVQSQTAGLVVPYSPEYRTLGPNLPLLTRLTEATGGKIQQDPSRIFRDAPSWVVGVTDLAPALLLLTALLFVGDIAVRRLAIRPEKVREGAARGVAAAQTRVATAQQSRREALARQAAVSLPRMDRLLERKTAARAATEDDAPRPPIPGGKEGTTASTAERLLNRRATRAADATDEDFPTVASLPRNAPPAPNPGGAKPGEGGYTNRLLDAKRRAKPPDEE
ncbi:MAG: VWA domain-containing protein [Armatimonadetes bacterium]|nr:VWA domain-containing protein [Armatimonadota bacterium]